MQLQVAKKCDIAVEKKRNSIRFDSAKFLVTFLRNRSFGLGRRSDANLVLPKPLAGLSSYLPIKSGLPDGLFSYQKIQIWLNFGGP
jgi:hypothetical protein